MVRQAGWSLFHYHIYLLNFDHEVHRLMFPFLPSFVSVLPTEICWNGFLIFGAKYFCKCFLRMFTLEICRLLDAQLSAGCHSKITVPTKIEPTPHAKARDQTSAVYQSLTKCNTRHTVQSVPIAICFSLNLSELHTVFVWIANCICLNFKLYLSK